MSDTELTVDARLMRSYICRFVWSATQLPAQILHGALMCTGTAAEKILVSILTIYVFVKIIWFVVQLSPNISRLLFLLAISSDVLTHRHSLPTDCCVLPLVTVCVRLWMGGIKEKMLTVNLQERASMIKATSIKGQTTFPQIISPD